MNFIDDVLNDTRSPRTSFFTGKDSVLYVVNVWHKRPKFLRLGGNVQTEHPSLVTRVKIERGASVTRDRTGNKGPGINYE